MLKWFINRYQDVVWFFSNLPIFSCRRRHLNTILLVILFIYSQFYPVLSHPHIPISSNTALLIHFNSRRQTRARTHLAISSHFRDYIASRSSIFHSILSYSMLSHAPARFNSLLVFIYKEVSAAAHSSDSRTIQQGCHGEIIIGFSGKSLS